MLSISSQSLAALEMSVERRRPASFGEWWERHRDTLGAVDRFAAATLFNRYAHEAAVAEIDPMDDEIFLWVAARYRMPEMGGRQYLATMDVIFRDGSDVEKLMAIDQIARTIPSDAE